MFISAYNYVLFFFFLSSSLLTVCLQYLAAGTIPGKLPTPCVDLSFLSIRTNFNDTEENLAALCLLRSSPNLQELEMLVSFLSTYNSIIPHVIGEKIIGITLCVY